MKREQRAISYILLLLFLVVSRDAAAQAPDFLQRDFWLVASHSGKCLNIAGGSGNDGTPIQQTTCSGSPPAHQRWKLAYEQSYQGYSINSKMNGPFGALLMTVDPFNASGNPASVYSYRAGYTSDLRLQLWDMQFMADGRVQLVNKYSGKCLDVSGNSPNDGANLQQYTCSGQNNQLFWLEPTYGYVQIKSHSSGKCVDVENASTANQAAIKQYSCNTLFTQQYFNVIPVNGRVRFVARHSGKCLDITGNSPYDGALFQQYQCVNGNPENQTFALSTAGTNSSGQTLYNVTRFANNATIQKRMDVAGNSPYDGAYIQQYAQQSPGDNQKWIIQ